MTATTPANLVSAEAPSISTARARFLFFFCVWEQRPAQSGLLTPAPLAPPRSLFRTAPRERSRGERGGRGAHTLQLKRRGTAMTERDGNKRKNKGAERSERSHVYA